VPVLETALPPRQRLLNYVGAYFDYIAANPRFPRVVQGEWIRTGTDRIGQMKRVARSYFQPIYQRLGEVLREGIAAGEFRPIDPAQFIPSMVAIIIFYFSAAPVIKTLMKVDPLAPERVAERRAFVLDFISAALFTRPVPEQGDRS
jgi:AcrR family transcriptional regulator